MNSRERVQTALCFEEPDRTPVFASFVPETERLLRESCNIPTGDVGVPLGNDMVKVCAGLEKSFYLNDEPEYTCPWGIRWKNIRNSSGHYTEIVGHPLAGDESKLDSYEIPDPHDPVHFEDLKAALAEHGQDKWIIGSCQITIFEASWYLRGLDQLMMDMMINPDYVDALMDKVMQFGLEVCRTYIEMGADMVWVGDDVAMQTGMMLSPDTWRRFLKPRYAKLFGEFKAKNPNIKIAYHSCGNCQDVLDELADIGLDVLNPIQPLAMDPVMVKKRFGKRLALFGGVDVQRLMPFGTPEEIAAEVKRLREHCGAGGGYILSPAHHVQSDTSVENIKAFYQAALA